MVPRALKHRFQVVVSNPEGKPSSGNDRDPTPQPPQTQSFIGAPLDVGKPAVVIAPPLKGPRWVVASGCCDTITYHRGATLPINGAIRVAERYAIDLVQLDDKNNGGIRTLSPGCSSPRGRDTGTATPAPARALFNNQEWTKAP
jgi:hypothetical protein